MFGSNLVEFGGWCQEATLGVLGHRLPPPWRNGWSCRHRSLTAAAEAEEPFTPISPRRHHSHRLKFSDDLRSSAAGLFGQRPCPNKPADVYTETEAVLGGKAVLDLVEMVSLEPLKNSSISRPAPSPCRQESRLTHSRQLVVDPVSVDFLSPRAAFNRFLVQTDWLPVSGSRSAKSMGVANARSD